jgi:hypothetical protein
MSATQTLILIIEQLVGDDESLKATVNDVKKEVEAEEAELADLKAQIAGLPAAGAPFDPTAIDGRLSALEASVKALQDVPAGGADTALADRVTALEGRNQADDAAAGGLGNIQTDPSIGISLTPTTLSDGQVGTDYAALLTAVGAASPVAFSIQSGSLPDGMSLAAGGGLTGTPTTAGPSSFVIQAHDANGAVGQLSYTLNVAAAAAPPAVEPLAFTTTSLPDPVVGTAYTASLEASGGTGAITFTADGIPDGLALDTAGNFSGTPTTPGALSATFTATDSAAPPITDELVLVMTVDPAAA